jgi:hypothetical protein
VYLFDLDGEAQLPRGLLWLGFGLVAFEVGSILLVWLYLRMLR